MARRKERVGGLNEQQRRFAHEYVADLNAKQAAIRAGYSPRTAESQGSRLLSHPKVSALVADLQRKRTTRLEITADRVLQELARVAFADIGQAFDEHGELLPVHKMPEDVRRAVASLESDELHEGSGAERAAVGMTRKVRLADKLRGLEMLGKHLKLFDGAGLTPAPDDGVVRIRRRGPNGETVEVEIGADGNRPQRLSTDNDAVGVPPGPDAGAGDPGRPR